MGEDSDEPLSSWLRTKGLRKDANHHQQTEHGHTGQERNDELGKVVDALAQKDRGCWSGAYARLPDLISGTFDGSERFIERARVAVRSIFSPPPSSSPPPPPSIRASSAVRKQAACGLATTVQPRPIMQRRGVRARADKQVLLLVLGLTRLSHPRLCARCRLASPIHPALLKPTWRRQRWCAACTALQAQRVVKGTEWASGVRAGSAVGHALGAIVESQTSHCAVKVLGRWRGMDGTTATTGEGPRRL